MPILEKKNTENNGVDNTIMAERRKGVENLVNGNETLLREKNDRIFTIRTNEAKKREYKSFFAKHGLSVSKGVQIAIDYLIDQAKKGNIELKDTGIFTR